MNSSDADFEVPSYSDPPRGSSATVRRLQNVGRTCLCRLSAECVFRSVTVTVSRILLLLIPVSLLQCPGFSQQPPEPRSGNQSPEPHGQRSHLDETLVRSGEMSRWFDQASAELKSGHLDAALELHLKILSQPADAFHFSDVTAGDVSLKESVVLTVRDAPAAYRAAWQKTWNPSALALLKSAVRSGSSRELLQVAGQFPLTDAGFEAEVLGIVQLLDRGAMAESQNALQYVVRTYQNEPRFRTRIQSLRRLINSTVARSADRDSSAEKLASELQVRRDASGNHTAVFMADGFSHGFRNVARPWSQPAWVWNDGIMALAGSGEAGAGERGDAELSLFDVAVENADEENSFSNWRPVVRDDVVVVRTSNRLIGLNRDSGRPAWELNTDTGQNVLAEALHRSEVGATAAFGLMAADTELLFFVDHFVNGASSRLRPMRRAQNRARNLLPGMFPGGDALSALGTDGARALGTRLVALRFPAESPERDTPALPVVAWIVGDPSDFEYRVQGAGVASVSASTVAPGVSGKASDVVTPNPQKAVAVQNAALPKSTLQRPNSEDQNVSDSEFAGHRFLSPPAGNGIHLFVLTAGHDQVWVNCIERSSGVLVWRQPVAFDTDGSFGPAEMPDPSEADICVLYEDLVICGFSSGVIAAMRQCDGILQWATSVRDEAVQTHTFSFGYPADTRETAVAFLPMLAGKLLICACPESVHVCALDARTGKIQWQADRRAQSGGVGSESRDQYVGAVSSGRIILLGKRHCRALDAASGDQVWAVETFPASGRALCSGDQCLIPESDGSGALIDLETGRVDRISHTLFPEGSRGYAGSITCDSEFTFLSTPVSVTACRRVDRMLDDITLRQPASELSDSDLLLKSRLLLLAGNRSAAIQLLTERRLAGRDGLPESSGKANVLHELAAELILQEAGRSLFPETPGSGMTAESLDLVSTENEDLLPGLQLRPDQRIRSEVFQELRRNRLIRQPESTAPNAGVALQRRIWPETLTPEAGGAMISVDGDWLVRADLLLNAECGMRPPVLPQLTAVSRQPGKSQQADPLITPNPRIMDSILLMPEQAGGWEQRLAAAEEWYAAGWLEYAECLVLASMEIDETRIDETRIDDTENDDTESRGGSGKGENTDAVRVLRHRKLLDQIRGGTAADPLALPENSEANARSFTENHSRHRTGFVTLSQESLTDPPDSLMEQLSRLTPVYSDGGPGPIRWMLEQRTKKQSMLRAFDLSDGTQTDDVSVSFIPYTVSRADNSPKTPRLIVVGGEQEVAAIAWTRTGTARRLWERDVRSENRFGNKQIVAGPVGASFCLWQSSSRLHCTHPLTGLDLWSRDCSQSASDGFTRPNLLLGDRDVTVLMGTTNENYSRFRTRDGRYLGSGKIDVSRSSSAEVIGRRLLYADRAARVRLFDGLTQSDVLEDQEPVQLNPGEGFFRRLDNNRVVTVSRSQEIVLIDANDGRICFRTPVDGMLNTRFVFGLTAFERSGLLYVGLNDEQAFNQQYETAHQLGEPRVDYGRLFCIDPADGRIVWSRRTEPSVIPPIAGDASDLLVTWSLVMSGGDVQHRGNSRKLRIQVLDAATGQMLAENPGMNAAIPLRCVHDAVNGKILIYCRGAALHDPSIVRQRSVITISAG